MKVFVASATLDAEWVARLRSMLEESSRSSWQTVPPIGLHPDWRIHARQSIESSDALLFVTTPRSVTSPHCLWELSTAVELGKPCFQWIVEPVEGAHDASPLPVIALGDPVGADGWDFRAAIKPPTQQQESE